MGSGYKKNMSASEQEAYIKSKVNDAFSLSSSAKEKIPEFFVPDKFKDLLGLFSRFHRYSHINIILIYLQLSKATYLAGFDTWQTTCLKIWNNPTRQILKQEHKGKGIRILAPYTHVVDKQDRRLINYVVPVYDISQTNDLPPLEQDEEFVSQARLNKMLSAVRRYSPYRITIAGNENTIIENGVPGYCDHSNQLIVLNESLRNSKLLTEMVRQIITAELEQLDYTNENHTGLIVESVVYIIGKHFGSCIDAEDNSFSFIVRHAEESSDDLAEAFFAVRQLSHKFIETVESFLCEIEEYDSFAWIDEEAMMDFDMQEAIYEV